MTKQSRFRLLFRWLLAAAFVLFLPLSVFAGAIYIPDNHPTIQAGIDAAVDGDIIMVRDGIYKGTGNKNLSFRGKLLTVKSENGPQQCIIDCEGSGRAFYLPSLSDAGPFPTIAGFTMTNGNPGPMSLAFGLGGAIYIGSGVKGLITDCIIKGNVGGSWGGGGIFFGGTMNITNCIISENTAISTNGGNQAGGGMWITDGVVDNCIIANKKAAGEGGGGIVIWGGSPTIRNCKITGNTGGVYGGGIFGRISSATISNCLISENTSTGQG